MPTRGYSRGGSITEFETVDSLVLAHESQPLANGSVWMSLNPELFGSVVEGALVPDPVTLQGPLFKETTSARVVWRGFSPELNADNLPHDIEGA